MSNIVTRNFNMPEELFCSDDPLARAQYISIRKEASKEFADLQSQLAALKEENVRLRAWVAELEKVIETARSYLFAPGLLEKLLTDALKEPANEG